MSLSLSGVTRRVGREIHIHETDLELAPGAVTVLLGPTLAGKTTLMRLMAGLDRPTTGRVIENGRDITGLSVRRRSVAMVYQQFINYPSFTVYENIASPLRRSGVDAAEIDRRVRETAETLRIDPLLGRLPQELSGGQQQRTALARALVKGADLLLLDEPLVNLDYKLREELRAELRAIFSQRAAIAVYATTEPLEALMMGGSTIVVHEGRVRQVGPTAEVFKNPVSEAVGHVFSDPPMNMIDVTVDGGVIAVDDDLRFPAIGHLAGLPDGRFRLGLRSPHLHLHRSGPDQVPVRGTVELSEINGSETFVHVAHHGVSWVAQELGVHTLSLGAAITVYLDPHHAFAFDAAGMLAASPARAAG